MTYACKSKHIPQNNYGTASGRSVNQGKGQNRMKVKDKKGERTLTFPMIWSNDFVGKEGHSSGREYPVEGIVNTSHANKKIRNQQPSLRFGGFWQECFKVFSFIRLWQIKCDSCRGAFLTCGQWFVWIWLRSTRWYWTQVS